MATARRHLADSLGGWFERWRLVMGAVLGAPLAPMIALVLGATIWAGATLLAIEAARSDARERIEYWAEHLRRQVESGLAAHESLAGLLRLMVHHEHADPFDGFLLTDNILRPQYPAVVHLAFLRRVEHAELQDYERALRNQLQARGESLASGLRPGRKRDFYYFLEREIAGNMLGAPGTDLSDHPTVPDAARSGRASQGLLMYGEDGWMPALMVRADLRGREVGYFCVGLDFQVLLDRSMGGDVPAGWNVRLLSKREPARQYAQVRGPLEEHDALDAFTSWLGRFGGNVSDYSDIPFGGEMFRLQVSGPSIATAGLALYLPWAVFLIGALITAMLYLLVKHVPDARNAANALADLRELQARRSEQRFRDLVESSSDWIWEVDADFRLRYASATAKTLIGVAPAQLVGRRIESLLADGQLAFPFGQGAPVAYTGHQRRFRASDGTELTFESAGTPILDAEGEFAGMRGMDRDVTAQRSFRDRLARLQEELSANMQANLVSQLLSGIAHELNQPLSAIASYNQACIRLLDSGRAEAGELAKAMQATAANALLAGDIVKRLRRVTAHREPQTQPAGVPALVSNVLALLEHRLRAGRIEVKVHVPENLPRVMVDSVLVTQVMLNLVHNAADAMADAPQRHMSIDAACVSGRHVRISIADTGSGVAPDNVNRIFDPYFSTKKHGMGIGLTISRSIVEALGGSLECVQVSGQDAGAIFVIELPVEGQLERAIA